MSQSDTREEIFSFALALPLAQGYADLGLAGYNDFANVVRLSQENETALPHEIGMHAIAPAMMLAFAAELYIKILVFQRSEKFPRGHKLDALINKLPREVRLSVKKRYNQCVNRPGRPLALTYKLSQTTANSSQKFEKLAESESLGDSFEDAVRQASPLFEQLRYLFEEVADGFSANIDFSWLIYLVDALRSEVLSYSEGNVKISFNRG